MYANDNPYASPQSLAGGRFHQPPRLTFRRMVALVGIGLTGGALLGGLTNSVNGVVSPQYYRDVMDWPDTNIWLRAVGQGVLEGSVYGSSYAVVFILLIALASRRRCRFATVLRYAAVTFGLALVCWVFGGIMAVEFRCVFSNHCDPRIFGNQSTWPAAGYYAWVRGSIWGGIFGGLGSVLLTSTAYAILHRRIDLGECQPHSVQEDR